MDGLIDWWVGGWVDRRAGGRTVGLSDGRTDRQKDR